MNIKFETDLDEIRRVPDNRSYWFVRTYSGQTFDDFIESGYIGIGLNNVPLKLIEESSWEGKKSKQPLLNYISNNTGYKGKEATKWAHQLMYFYHDMKIGDYVLIPSTNSDKLAIGEITSDLFVITDRRTFYFEKHYEPYPEKRRRVNWLSVKPKSAYLGDLKNVFFSRQAITEIPELQNVLEGQVSSLYIANDIGHLVIQIKQDEEINAFHFSRFLDSITYFYQEYCEFSGIPLNEELYIKIKIQSRGKTVLKAGAVVALMAIGALVTLSDNQEVALEYKDLKVKGKSDGFLKSFSKFLDEKEERRQRVIIFNDSMESLKATRNLQMESEKDVTNSSEEEGVE
jgi:hypothetical protein